MKIDTNIEGNLKRGTIVYVRNGNRGNHLTSGDRPAVIVQNEMGNCYSPNLIVCFLTSKLTRMEMPTRIIIQHYENLCTSIIQAEQITTIDKGDVVGIVGQLRPEDVVRMDAAIKASLGLEG